MTWPSAPPGWYPDPAIPGAQRYFDGASWTGHTLPPPPGWYGPPPWKGARFGLPASGPGALASPASRFGARLLDSLVLLPVSVAVLTVALVVAAPHIGPLFPKTRRTSPGTVQLAGFFWFELLFLGCGLFIGLVSVVYETVMTVKWGRTLGKRWVGIRPLRTNGSPLSFGRALGRVASYWGALAILNWLGAIDSLWCLWDGDSQCLHDKVADTMVVNDRRPVAEPTAQGATGTWPRPGPGEGPGAPQWPGFPGPSSR